MTIRTAKSSVSCWHDLTLVSVSSLQSAFSGRASAPTSNFQNTDPFSGCLRIQPLSAFGSQVFSAASRSISKANVAGTLECER